MRKAAAVLFALLLLQVPPEALGADESEQIDFDIYRHDSLMTVWVDLSPLITSKRVSQMEEGIDMALEYQLSLLRPKRLWGAHKIEQVTGVFQIGYRLITKDYFIAYLTSDPKPDKHFLSLGELHKFLADSISIGLTNIDSLDQNRRYHIQMALTCVSLTSFNVTDDEDSGESGKSAIKWLFKEFLDLTNFGRQDYTVESRLFSISEISSRR